MTDFIETLDNTIIQHGKHNDRIYVMHLETSDYPQILDKLDSVAKKHSYSKVFAKIPASCYPGFIQHGYHIEAYIPDYYKNSEDALFLGRYYTQERQAIPNKELHAFQRIFDKEKKPSFPVLEKGYTVRNTGAHDAVKMSFLYRKVFKSYPFPIDDPEYLLKMMKKDVTYFSIWKEKKLVGLASSEMDRKNKSVEMTDFAVDPAFRGKKFGSILLLHMASEMEKIGIKTLFTIARLASIGMNKIFYNAGYTYSGTLLNNTNISGSLESMNVWYKHIDII